MPSENLNNPHIDGRPPTHCGADDCAAPLTTAQDERTGLCGPCRGDVADTRARRVMGLTEFLDALQDGILQVGAERLHHARGFYPVTPGGLIRWHVPCPVGRNPAIPPVLDAIGVVLMAEWHGFWGPMEAYRKAPALLGMSLEDVATVSLASDREAKPGEPGGERIRAMRASLIVAYGGGG